jgi:hypothetical protein
MRSIKESELKLLAETGALSNVKIEPVQEKWAVVARVGLDERVLFNGRGAVREFPNLNRLAIFLKELGVPTAQIKLI